MLRAWSNARITVTSESLEEKTGARRRAAAWRARRVLLAVALALAAARRAGAQAAPPAPESDETPRPPYRVEIAAGVWETLPNTVQYADTEGALVGTTIDFRNQLGLERRPFPEIHLEVQATPRQKARGEYVPLRYQQTVMASDSLAFNGQFYAAGRTITSTFRWKAWRVEYEYDLLVREHGYIGGFAALRAVDVDGTLSDGSQSGTAGVRIPMPGLGVIAGYRASPRLWLTGKLAGFDLPGASTKTHGHGFDVDGYVNLGLTRVLGIRAGFRVYDVSYVYANDQNAGTFTIGGPYLAGTVRF
jgi:hypothetical protein